MHPQAHLRHSKSHIFHHLPQNHQTSSYQEHIVCKPQVCQTFVPIATQLNAPSFLIHLAHTPAITSCSTALKSGGLIGSPCLVPLPILKCQRFFLSTTFLDCPSYIRFNTSMYNEGTPCVLIAFQIARCSTVSNAFAKSTAATQSAPPHSPLF